jgi:hypothetical protein
MAGAEALALSSIVSLLLRLAGVAILSVVVYWQYLELRRKSVLNLRRLKRLLLGLVVAITLSNIPIMLLHIDRILQRPTDFTITSIATVSNAAAMLLQAVLLYAIYRYRTGKD